MRPRVSRELTTRSNTGKEEERKTYAQISPGSAVTKMQKTKNCHQNRGCYVTHRRTYTSVILPDANIGGWFRAPGAASRQQDDWGSSVVEFLGQVFLWHNRPGCLRL